MKTIKYKATGISALLMHDDKTANPMNEFTKELKKLTSKRSKTDDDYNEIAKLEFEASLYYNEGYVMPSKCIEATLLAAAKKFKLGVLYKQSVLVPEDAEFKFKHSNLKPIDLFDNKKYVDIRTVKIGTSKTVRCRPIFPEWSFEFDIILDDEMLNEEQVEQVVQFAGKYIGICDYRPRYGRFSIEKVL